MQIGSSVIAPHQDFLGERSSVEQTTVRPLTESEMNILSNLMKDPVSSVIWNIIGLVVVRFDKKHVKYYDSLAHSCAGGH